MQCLYAILQQGNIFSCTRRDPLTVMCHQLYYLNKYTDLMDTIIFVFRKKQNQITFLHVYHHVAVIGCTVFGLYFLQGIFTSETVKYFLIKLHNLVFYYRWIIDHGWHTQFSCTRCNVLLLLYHYIRSKSTWKIRLSEKANDADAAGKCACNIIFD